MFDALYLSPHFDDAVLSCGAQIWDRTARGEKVVVATVCAAPPPGPEGLSPFAFQLHQRWSRFGEFDRAQEDWQAVARLGAETRHLRFHDCIYRRSPVGAWLYQSETAIFGEVSPSESSLAGEIAGAFARIIVKGNAAIFVPYGIGHHVDHQLTRLAAEKWLGSESRSFQYYADYPYAEKASGGVEVPVSDEGRRRKIEAIRAYQSQLSSFWEDEAGMVARAIQWPERVF